MQSDEIKVATHICEIIQSTGHQAVFAGGCVRDIILQEPYNDIDIATDCPEPELLGILRGNGIKTKSVGKAFGVVLAQVGEHTFEIARFRKDINCDGRRPESVHFCTMEEDARRRDFTINAVFYDPVSGKYYDFVNGIEDIRNQKLRFVGNPADRIREDYLRVLRYVRFYAKGFTPLFFSDIDLVDSFAGEMLNAVSPERIRMELMDKVFPALKNTGAFNLFPILFNLLFDGIPDRLKHIEQNPKWHPEGDVWLHTRLVIGSMLEHENKTPLLILAAIFHDFGKLTTTAIGPDNEIHSPSHERVSADMAVAWMINYKFSSDEIAYVAWLVLNHMKLHYPGLKKSSLKRMMHEGDIHGLLALTLCDCLGSDNDLSEYRKYDEKIKAILSEGTSVRPAPLVTGHDLIRAGLKPGPSFGAILSRAYDHQLEDEAATKETLLKEALENAAGQKDTL